jgi:uncharacterized protein (TIGR02246 family)
MGFQAFQQSTTMAADEAAVRALYQQMMDGWTQGSGQAFSAPFDDDGDFIAFDGTHFKGRREIASSHQPLFEKWLKGTRLVGKVTNIRFLSPDVVLMHASGGTVMPGASAPSPERDSIQTLVATKQEGGWRLVAFQNTRVRPIGRNVAGTLVWMLSDWLWKMCRPKT